MYTNAALAKMEAEIQGYRNQLNLIGMEEYEYKHNQLIEDKLIDLVLERLQNKETWVKTASINTQETDIINIITKENYKIDIRVEEELKVIHEGINDSYEFPKLEVSQMLIGENKAKGTLIVNSWLENKSDDQGISQIVLLDYNGKVLQTKKYDTPVKEAKNIEFDIYYNTEYIIKSVTNKNKKSIEYINVTNIFNDREIKIIKTPDYWTKGNVTVTIDSELGKREKLQYRISQTDEWKLYTEPFQVDKNYTIEAKIVNTKNQLESNITKDKVTNIDRLQPELDIIIDKNTNSIMIKANAKDAEPTEEYGCSGIKCYYFSKDNGTTWEEIQTEEESYTYTFSKLKTGTYPIAVKVCDKVGNETIVKQNVTLNVVATGDITIAATPTTPRNTGTEGTQNGIAKGPISVTVSFGNSNYTRQYKVGSGSWTTVSGTSTTFTVEENTAIVARYYDGTNGFETETYNIQNVDNVAPNTFEVSATSTTNKITASASTTDTASSGAASGIAGILRYEYKINSGTWQTSNEFNNLTTGTYTVQAKAIDKAGNERISTNTASITLETVSTGDIKITSTPTTARNTGTAGTQNGIAKGPISVTVSFGNSNYTRQYKVGSGSWTTVSKESVTFTVTENTAIVARYYDGTNGFQSETYNIQNVDNVSPTFSSYNANVSGATITATGAATDTASSGAASGIAGILRYEYSINGSSYQTSNKFTVTTAGNYTVYIKAIDKAGNQTVATKAVTVSNYTVTYNANGGSGAPSAQWAVYGTKITLSSTQPTRTGYTFLGWSTSSTATSADYATGASYTVTENATLYATWALDKPKMTLFKMENEEINLFDDKTTKFEISVTGAELKYQWYYNNTAISGATGKSYSIPTTSMTESGIGTSYLGGTYKCIVKNTAGSVSGSGEQKITYTVENATQISNFAKRVNNQGITFATLKDNGGEVSQIANINLSTVCGPNINGNKISWTPIGKNTTNNCFSGKFNGGSYNIDGLYINTTANNQGLFGITNNAIIQNVTIKSGSITSTGKFIGGIVGYTTGNIFNCTNSANIDGGNNVGGIAGSEASSTGTISQCTNTGNITASYITGGITGWSYGSINKCKNSGKISCEYLDKNWVFVGGICGINSGMVSNCYNTQTVTGNKLGVGGICGQVRNGTISNCYNIGDIRGIVNDIDFSGGICGYNKDYEANVEYKYTINSCYYLEKTAKIGITEVPDVVGQAESKTGTYMKSTAFVNLLGNSNWKIVSGKNNGYPILNWE